MFCPMAGDQLRRWPISQVRLGVVWGGSTLSEARRADCNFPCLQDLSRKNNKNHEETKTLFLLFKGFLFWLGS